MCTMSRQCPTMSGHTRCINPYIVWTLFRILAPPHLLTQRFIWPDKLLLQLSESEAAIFSYLKEIKREKKRSAHVREKLNPRNLSPTTGHFSYDVCAVILLSI